MTVKLINKYRNKQGNVLPFSTQKGKSCHVLVKTEYSDPVFLMFILLYVPNGAQPVC